jgi:hypothetical protein
MIKRLAFALALSLAPVALATATADAQAHRAAFGLAGGWSMAGDLTPGLPQEGFLESGWTAGAQLELWPGPRRVGLRLNASVAERKLENTQRAFRIAAADLGLVVRLLSARDDRGVAPFVALGAGPVVYMAEDASRPLGDGAYGEDPVVRLMVAPSVGADFFNESSVALRLEVAHQIVFPAVGESPAATGVPVVHNPGARVALLFRVGRAAPRVVVRSPGPAPGPAPATAPAPVELAPAGLAPPGSASALYTVRVGTFADPASARAWVSRLEGEGVPVWLTEATVGGRPMIRVTVGAVDSHADATLLAEKLRLDFGYDTRIDAIPADRPLPARAILETLRFLDGR